MTDSFILKIAKGPEWGESITRWMDQMILEARALSSAGPDISSARQACALQAAPAHEDDLAVDRFAAAMKAKLAKKRNVGRGGWSGPECSEETLSRMLRDHIAKGDPVDVANFAMMLHQRGERIAQAAPALSKTDREWLIALLTHDQGELLNAYGVGAEVRQSDPELHGFAVAQADAILERLSQSSELAQINAMLMEGQGDDDGPQILPDFEPDWSVTAKVEACLFLLEKRRDVIAARAPSDGLREAVWQSMDSAPTDGTNVLLAIKFGPFVYTAQGMYHDRKWHNATDRDGEILCWMPNIMMPDHFLPWTEEYAARAVLIASPAEKEGRPLTDRQLRDQIAGRDR